MYGFPRPLIPNDVQWNRHRAPHNPQWRPFFGPRAQFRPRNLGFQNYGAPMMQGGNEEHWCETCDRGFPSEDILSKHKQQHQKCNIDGCQFVAHPKVITKHIQMQHSSGLYKKIAKLNNPEEIDKWRAERRNKYPTKTNIDKKAAELKEKIDRGEKMGLQKKHWSNKQNGNTQNNDFYQGQGRKRTHHNDNYNHESKWKKPRKQIPRTPKVLPATEENRSLAPFAGIQSLIIDSIEEVDEILSCNDVIIEDDDIEIINSTYKHEDKPKVEKMVVCGALSSLMCDYGSSDEDIDMKLIKHEDNKKEISIKMEKIISNYTPEKVQNTSKIDHESTRSDELKYVKEETVSQQVRNEDEIIQHISAKCNDTTAIVVIKVKEEIIPEQIIHKTENDINIPQKAKNICEENKVTIDTSKMQDEGEIIPQKIMNETKAVQNASMVDHKPADYNQIKADVDIALNQIVNVTDQIKDTCNMNSFDSKLVKKKKVDPYEDSHDGGPDEERASQIQNTIIESNVIRNPEQTIIENNKSNLGKCEDDEDSEPEEVKVVKHVDLTNIDAQKTSTENKSQVAKKRVETVRKPVYRKPKPKLPSTLIYKLLSKEMKKERNKVLQCIRFIRKNNYFDKCT